MLLSHSPDVAAGVKALAQEMHHELSIYAIGGAKDGGLGSDYDTTSALLNEAVSAGAVIILFDLGSTMMTIQMAIEELDDAQKEKVYLCDSALVEGAIVAAACLNAGMDLEMVLAELQKISLHKL